MLKNLTKSAKTLKFVEEEVLMADQLKVIWAEDTTRFFFVPHKAEPYSAPKKLQSLWLTDAVEEAKVYGPGTVLKAVADIEKASG